MPCKPLYRSTHALYSHNFALEGAIFALEAPYLLFALLLMLEPQPVTYYEPDVPGGQTHTLSPEESPIEPWEAYLTQPSSPVSCKHSLSPTSLPSAPIHQRTNREGGYQSITPSASSPIAGTSPQSQGYQSTSPGGSADNPSSTQSSADDADSDIALNWVTINTDYLKG